MDEDIEAKLARRWPSPEFAAEIALLALQGKLSNTDSYTDCALCGLPTTSRWMCDSKAEENDRACWQEYCLEIDANNRFGLPEFLGNSRRVWYGDLWL